MLLSLMWNLFLSRSAGKRYINKLFCIIFLVQKKNSYLKIIKSHFLDTFVSMTICAQWEFFCCAICLLHSQLHKKYVTCKRIDEWHSFYIVYFLNFSIFFVMHLLFPHRYDLLARNLWECTYRVKTEFDGFYLSHI